MTPKVDVKTVTLSIDGQEVSVPEGTTLMNAATQAGIDIPTLCYLKELAPDGSCRMCTVEIEGAPKGGLVTACTAEARDGMVIHTQNKKVRDSRRFVLDLLLSNHKLDCFKCPSNGDCKLQDYALEYGMMDTTFTGKRQAADQIDSSNPFFDYDPEKCIMCRRCERVCAQRQGQDVIAASQRGFDTKMSPSYGEAWDQSICESCGNCVSACPVGALTAKDHQKYRAFNTTKVRTTCPHCGTGCQLDLIVNQNNVIVGAEPANGPANRNLLCVKGKFASYKFVASPDRIDTPLIKRNGKFEKATWEEAMDLVASKFTELKETYGGTSLAGFSCSRSTNEDNFVFQKMVRTAFASNNVDNCARLCHSASVHGLAHTLGSGAMTNTIEDITTDVDAILLIGSNTTEAHPVIGVQIRQAVQHGAKLIVVDPRQIDLTKHAALTIQPKAGTNVAFINGLMHVIIKEGLEDQDFINKRTENYEAMKKVVADYTPEVVGKICEIDPEAIVAAARMYAKADKAPIIYCLGVTEHSTGTEGVMSMSNLAMLVGKVGRPGCGVNPLRGQNNVQGACDMGCSPFDFPGYQKVANPEVVAKFENAWGTELNPRIGLTSTQVLPAAIKKQIHGLYIFGEDPIVTDPNTAHVRQALESLDFLVVQELFMTETAAYADVILPGISFAEKDGTFTNTERRIQRIRKAVEPTPGAREDFKIFCEVATRMGYPMSYEASSKIMDEIASLVPTFGGVNFKRLENPNGLQWPCRDLDDPGTPIMHVGTFTRGKGLFMALPYKPAQELPDEEYPFLMSTGRMLYQYNTGAMTRRTEGINKLAGRSYIEINIEDANRYGIQDGDKVQVSSRRGTIETYAHVGNIVLPEAVFMTFHFADGNVNELTNSVFDDIARIPEYKVCAVKIKPLNTRVAQNVPS
ncbi:formate dehydrogenase subunit alpha [Agrilactobacillus composti]|nr:formate dehydrogenase subunit alpha [Agrilactobacillus composti]